MRTVLIVLARVGEKLPDLVLLLLILALIAFRVP